ncbi:hypothetical protein OQA88_665 [Cercophora sp. LCS_1]
MDLYDSATFLINLQCKFCWKTGQTHKSIAPILFAANLPWETPRHFLRALNEACMKRIRSTMRFHAYGSHPFSNYESERYFVWRGFETSKLAISSLTQSEIRDQLDLMAKRGYRDWIQVEMAIEIDSPETATTTLR